MAFAEDHRILIPQGSVDAGDDLKVHLHELAPAGEAALRQKVRTAQRQLVPCFDHSPLLMLLQVIAKATPSSVEADQATTLEQIGKLLKKQATGVDPQVAEAEKAKQTPLASVIAKTRERPSFTPAESEALKNGIGLTLLLEKAMEGKFPQGFESFLGHNIRPDMSVDQLFAALEPYGGGGPALQAAAQKGVRAFGEALHLDPLFIDEVGRLTEHLAAHRFSGNLLQAWRIGRAQPGMAHMGIAEQIEAGIEPRVTQTITGLRAACHGIYDVSPEIAQLERAYTAHIRLVPPILAEATYRNGTMFVASQNYQLPSASGGILMGFNRHNAPHGDDVGGVCCITTAQGQGADDAARVVVHEMHHLRFPNQLSPEQIAREEALAASDTARLATICSTLKIWSAGNDEQKATAIRQLETQFTGGKPLAEMLGGKSVETLSLMANEALDRLTTDSRYFRRGNYNENGSRYNEIVSRYAELRFVRLREEPAVLKFLVPGLTEAYDTIYLPHIERQVAEMRQRDAKAASIGMTAANTNTPAPQPHASAVASPPSAPAPAPQTQVATKDVVHGAPIIAASPPMQVSL